MILLYCFKNSIGNGANTLSHSKTEDLNKLNKQQSKIKKIKKNINNNSNLIEQNCEDLEINIVIDSCINNNNVSQKHSPASSTHSSLLHITTAKHHDYHIPETIHVDENSIHIQSSIQQKHDCSNNSYNNKKNTKEFQLFKTIACPTPPAQENIQSLDDGDDKKLVPSQLNSNFYIC